LSLAAITTVKTITFRQLIGTIIILEICRLGSRLIGAIMQFAGIKMVGTVIILDPSYGTIAVGNSLADAESSWERASVNGFCWVWFTITNNTPVRTFYPYNTIRTMYKTNGPLVIWTNGSSSLLMGIRGTGFGVFRLQSRAL
jgi:hypothetical protein